MALLRVILAVLLAAALPLVHAGAATEAPATRSLGELRLRLTEQLGATGERGARWGVLIQSERTGETLFSTNADQLFVPASNTKLFICALALDRLGGDHRLMTTVRCVARPDAAGRVAGDLVIVGGGDPGFVRREGAAASSALAPLASAIYAAGVRRVDGRLILDDGAFHGPVFGGGWSWEDLASEWAPPVTALSVNDNTLRVRLAPRRPGEPAEAALEDAEELTLPGAPAPLRLESAVITGGPKSAIEVSYDRLPGSPTLSLWGSIPAGASPHFETVSAPSPTEVFGRLLRHELLGKGVQLDGGLRVASAERSPAHGWEEAPGVVLAQIASAPVSELVRSTMKPSQNLHAQLLLLAVGRAVETAPRGGAEELARGRTTETTGLRALQGFLARAGIPAGQVWLEEGAGLSRKNLVSPRAVAALLRFMAAHPAAGAWKEALPVGGVDGTLRNRFTSGPAKGNVRAKTGTLSGVNSLSGYVVTASGEPLVFSILGNNCVGEGGAERARREIDRIVTLLAGYDGPAVERARP